MKYNYDLWIDKFLWRGTPIIGHPDDKLEFVDIKMDYLTTISTIINAFKKHGVPKSKVIWSDKLKPIIMRPDSIELEGDNNDN